MGRSKKKRLSYRFIPVPAEVVESEAWENLTNAARVAYVHMCKKLDFNYRRPVSVTYSEMERIMTRRAFANAIRQLKGNGLITKTQQGGIFRKRNYFQMSESWRRIEKRSTGRKDNISGISIKSSQTHTVESENNGSTNREMQTVEIRDTH